jgi:hypothetical protein
MGFRLRFSSAISRFNTRNNMSKKNTTAKATPEAFRLDAFTVRNYKVGEEEKSEWSKVGIAFPHADGDGYRLQLQALPVDGIVVLRKHTAKPAE